MNTKISKIIIIMLAISISCNIMPIRALNKSTDIDSPVNSGGDDSNIALDLYELDTSKYSSIYKLDRTNLIKTLDFSKSIDIDDRMSPTDVEERLMLSGLVNVPTSDIRLYNNYNGDNMESIVSVMTEQFMYKNKGTPFDPVTKLYNYAPSSNSTLDAVSGAIIIKTEDKQTKVILRYYCFDKTLAPIAGISYDGVKNNSSVYIQDFDMTKLISSIIPTTDTPILKTIKDSYNNYARTLEIDLQKKQLAIFKEYSESSYYKLVNDFVSGVNSTIPVMNVDTTVSKRDSYLLYVKALNQSNIFKFDILNGVSNNFPGLSSNKEAIDASTEDYDNSSKIDVLTALTEANTVATEYANITGLKYINKGIESNASLFNDLVRYKFGIITGAPERGVGSNAADERIPSSTLDKFLLSYDDDLAGLVLNTKLWCQFENMKKLSSSVSINEYLDIMTSVQYLEEYASSEVPYSGINSDGINEELEDAIKFRQDEDNKDKPLAGSASSQARAYIQIKDGLDFLGIVPWTDNLKYICSLYDSLLTLNLDSDFDSYDPTSDNEPLKSFFTLSDGGSLSPNYMTGVALSATYIPMQTNLYDPTSIKVLKNEEWLTDFHVKYGFHRKALMIDVNVNAAVDGYITGSRDVSRVAVLGDLLQYQKDIVLYVDDNFYNTDEVADMVGKAYERLVNTEQSGKTEESFNGTIDNLFGSSIEGVLKTGSYDKYDKSTIKDTTEYGKSPNLIDFDGFMESLFTNNIIMSSGKGSGDVDSNEIKKGIEQDEYSSKQSYAVVSGIYRHKELAERLNAMSSKPKPVFVSSPALFNVSNVPSYEFNSIYNYYMLRNLESSMGIDYKTTLDLDNPLYIDIYGNIITESGLVVIPAASNATLYPSNTYTPYTVGFMSLYSKGDNIPTKNEELVKRLPEFKADDSGSVLLQRNYEFNNIPVNPQSPSVSSHELLEVLYDNQVSILNRRGYDFKQRIWLITEVLRGAPADSIDKVKEGIVGRRDVNKYGLFMSYKLDELANALLPTTNGNSIVSMPNISFMKGIEYLVLFLFKAVMLLFVCYIMYRIYMDAIGGVLGLRTIWQCVSTISIFCICIYLIPNVINFSYNEPNKILLQDEVKYINLLNYEKSLEGREISAVNVSQPKSQTELFLKLDDVKVPWYKVLEEVMFSPVGTTLSELYKEELESNFLYGFDGVQVVNDGVYININDVLKSSSVIYNNNNHFLYQNMNSVPTSSFFIPYYYNMDHLLMNISRYNSENGIINVTTKIQSDGSVKTMGMIGGYLLSEYFLVESTDPLGFYAAYGIEKNERGNYINYDFKTEESIKNALWYTGDYYSIDDISSRIEQVYSYMRAYVTSNREMIGRVTDETFIKAMLLDISMEYNQIFRVPSAKSIEIFSIDSRDLIRLSITDKGTAVTNSSQSFGKFVYDQSGELGVILTTILIGVYFLTSIVKPAFVIFLCVLLVYNIILKRMINMERGKTVEGLLYLLATMVVVNGSYALVLKLSMILPNLGMSPVISIIGQIVIQSGYLFLVFKVIGIVLKDYANFGYNVFNQAVLNAASAVSGVVRRDLDKFVYSKDQQYYMDSSRDRYDNDRRKSDDLRDEMYRRDKKRDQAQEETAFKRDYDRSRETRDRRNDEEDIS